MNAHKSVKAIQTKRSPPMWAVKIGARYAMSFMGASAKERAMSCARKVAGF